MQTKLLLAAVAIGSYLAGMQVSAYAQGASAYPQSLTPYDSYQATSGWDYYTPGAPRYYNEVPAQQRATVRTHHRANVDHTGNWSKQ